MTSIGYFITPHGFGHATRAASVMAAVRKLDATVAFHIFTRVPRWLFEMSLPGSFAYHDILTDIGLVQNTSLDEDVSETVRRLDRFLPFDTALVDRLAGQVLAAGCGLVLCDIAPLGVAVARAAGLPSVLVENFTWDWIYQAYAADEPRLEPHIACLREWFGAATYHIQAEPVCDAQPCHLRAAPVCRDPRLPRSQVRARLDVPDAAPLVLITMGGIWHPYAFVPRLTGRDDAFFVVTDDAPRQWKEGRVVHLPYQSGFFHPDLVRASDAVIGKIGYSTVAEVYHAGIPLGYVPRPRFRESAALAAYIDARMPSLAISADEFESGDWLARLPQLLALPRVAQPGPNGADQIARFVLDAAGRAGHPGAVE